MTRQYLFVGVTIGVCATLVIEQLRFNHFEQPAVAEQPSLLNEEALDFGITGQTRLVAQAAPAPLRKKPRANQPNFTGRTIPDNFPTPVETRDQPRQTDEGLNPPPFKIEDPSESDLEALAPAEPTEEETTTLNELREQYCNLARTKSDQLNGRALNREIEKLQREIDNLNAAKKLFEAQQTLQNMIEQFPNSPAAERAKSMLAPKPAPPNNRPVLQPIPDPGFGEGTT